MPGRSGFVSRTWLVVLVLLAGTLLWWSSGRPVAGQAVPPLPDAAAQRQAILQELRRLNTQVDQIRRLLDSGSLRVRVVGPQGAGG